MPDIRNFGYEKAKMFFLDFPDFLTGGVHSNLYFTFYVIIIQEMKPVRKTAAEYFCLRP